LHAAPGAQQPQASLFVHESPPQWSSTVVVHGGHPQWSSTVVLYGGPEPVGDLGWLP
jgi:hypothetical protein